MPKAAHINEIHAVRRVPSHRSRAMPKKKREHWVDHDPTVNMAPSVRSSMTAVVWEEEDTSVRRRDGQPYTIPDVRDIVRKENM